MIPCYNVKYGLYDVALKDELKNVRCLYYNLKLKTTDMACSSEIWWFYFTLRNQGYHGICIFLSDQLVWSWSLLNHIILHVFSSVLADLIYGELIFLFLNCRNLQSSWIWMIQKLLKKISFTVLLITIEVKDIRYYQFKKWYHQ